MVEKKLVWKNWKAIGYGNDKIRAFSHMPDIVRQNPLWSLHRLPMNNNNWKHVGKESTWKSQLPRKKCDINKHDYPASQQQGPGNSVILKCTSPPTLPSITSLQKFSFEPDWGSERKLLKEHIQTSTWERKHKKCSIKTLFLLEERDRLHLPLAHCWALTRELEAGGVCKPPTPW